VGRRVRPAARPRVAELSASVRGELALLDPEERGAAPDPDEPKEADEANEK
jgi:hypothetical protein